VVVMVLVLVVLMGMVEAAAGVWCGNHSGQGLKCTVIVLP
jgi:hypothetical protein